MTTGKKYQVRITVAVSEESRIPGLEIREESWAWIDSFADVAAIVAKAHNFAESIGAQWPGAAGNDKP